MLLETWLDLFSQTTSMAVKFSGKVEISGDDMRKIVDEWFQKHYGHSILGVEYDKKSGKLVAMVEYEHEKPSEPPQDANRWPGLYAGIGEVIDSYRAKKKRFITYTELLDQLHLLEDNRGQKLFVKPDGTKLPMAIMRHRLAPSQLLRQGKGQTNLKNVKNDRRNGGLSFS